MAKLDWPYHTEDAQTKRPHTAILNLLRLLLSSVEAANHCGYLHLITRTKACTAGKTITDLLEVAAQRLRAKRKVLVD